MTEMTEKQQAAMRLVHAYADMYCEFVVTGPDHDENEAKHEEAGEYLSRLLTAIEALVAKYVV